jgi:hypothetical protein
MVEGKLIYHGEKSEEIIFIEKPGRQMRQEYLQAHEGVV